MLIREKVKELQIDFSSTFLHIYTDTDPKLAVFYLFDRPEYQVP